MTKTFDNWTYDDVATFLKERDFHYFDELAGVGKAWIKFYDTGGPDRIVEIKEIKEFFTIRAMKKIIRQSGIAEAEWLNWYNS